MGVVCKPEDKELFPSRFRSLKQLDRYRKLCLWLPVTIGSSVLPWGYSKSLTDEKILVADEKAITVFVKACGYLRHHSYKIVADWMRSQGYPISDDGLQKLFKDRPCWPEIQLPLSERMKL